MRTTLALGLLAVALAAAPASTLAAPPPAGPKFKLTVTLSPAALAKLTAKKEAVTISAMYGGEPNKAGESRAIEGEINLGNDDLTRVADGAKVEFDFTGKGFKAAEMKYVKTGTARILINGYSARRAFDDNILDCAIWDGTLAEAAAASPIPIACKLIEE
ncbi:MAG: hypothetical protein ABTQ29_06520 [Siculibacillus sp.]